jgi:hypothetical protein
MIHVNFPRLRRAPKKVHFCQVRDLISASLPGAGRTRAETDSMTSAVALRYPHPYRAAAFLQRIRRGSFMFNSPCLQPYPSAA